MNRTSQKVIAIAFFLGCPAPMIAMLASPASADTIYAISNADGRIIRFNSADPAGSVVTLTGSGSFTGAAGLAVGPDGNLYVGQSGDFSTIGPAVFRLNLETNAISTVYTFAAWDVFPGSLAFKGNDLLVGRNPFFQDTGAVVRLADATGGSPTASPYTSGFSLASSPGLALAADGSLYVSSMTYDFQTSIASGPVVKFDGSGAYGGEVIAGGTSTGLLGPTGLGIRGTTLLTASIMNGGVLSTDLGTNITSAFGLTGVPFGASPLAVLSDGGVMVGSAGGAGAIYRFDAAGNLVDTFNSGLGTVGGLAVVPVPEPSTILTAAIGIAASAVLLHRRRRLAGA